MHPLALSLRRSLCCCDVASFPSVTASKKKNLVFLGSPHVSPYLPLSVYPRRMLLVLNAFLMLTWQVALPVLDVLLDASSAPSSIFRLAAIVTQPPSGRDRGRKVMPSPVAQRALEKGFPHDLIFTPEKAGEGLTPFQVTESTFGLKLERSHSPADRLTDSGLRACTLSGMPWNCCLDTLK